jgi:hypothetical protein
MAKNSQHVIPNPKGGWSVKKGGASRATKVFDTQEGAITFARKISRNQGSELYVHKRDGTVRSKDSYGNDPFPPKG